MRMTSLCVGSCLALAVPVVGASAYPPAPPGESVDVYHGVEVADPWRWLEDVKDPQTEAWVRAQQALAADYLADLPGREPVQARLEQMLTAPSYGLPRTVAGTRYLQFRDGLAPQPVLLAETRDGSTQRTILDLNALDPTGGTSLRGWAVSPDGQYLAYGLSERGEDWTQIRIRDLRSGQDLPEVLRQIKFSNISWTRDSAGFFYSRYAAQEGTFDMLAGQSVWYHRVATPQALDIRALYNPRQPKWNYWAEVDDSGRWLLISVRDGATNANRLLVRDLGDPQDPAILGKDRLLVDHFRTRNAPIGVLEDTLYVHTTTGAPKGRVRALDLSRAPSRWLEVIPESADTLEEVVLAGGSLVTHHLRAAVSVLQQWSPLGEPQGELTPAGLAAISGLRGSADYREVFFARSTPVEPGAIWRADLGARTTEVWRAQPTVLDPALVQTERFEARSRDGTAVPYFVTRLRSATPDRPRPTWLYGYGGFNIPIQPRFSLHAPPWVEAGGLFVVTNLRGGGEFGEAWHQAGTKTQKQNVFDDFIAVAEDLIARGWTTPQQLAIHGRSNGGLLVGAVSNQRPELFAAAMPGVGVMDMLRFHRFTIGWAWTVDYGSSDNADEFRALRAYSPYHNIRSGQRYPAVLAYTADHDDRVVPGHSYKYMAALQAADTGPQPKLLRIESQGGHGAGKPTAARIAESRDLLVFAAAHTGLRYSSVRDATGWRQLIGK